MSKAAILIDGGYLLKRLPAVRADIDSTDPQEVGRAINQLVRGHLNQLNEVHQAPSPLRLLFRTFYYVAGDADFVPAAKLARREGVQFVLDPLWRSVSPDLLEHIDGLRSGFFRPQAG